jgi:hypothetical protein
MENPQMGMPAEMAAQGPSPEETAIYDQMRQEISPQEFSNEMLASASQVDPQAVAEFTEELRSLDVSPEELDALNDLVDQILAAPEQYDQLRQQFLAQGMPDDILPEQFDPYFFAALNMAVDQMIAAPTGVQAFAQGGIAELKPIAKAIASYGRNGDTMLAHITPAEARMLKRRGGSGTINPATGLPEFFLKKAFKSIGKAVKKFASSTVGRIVTTVALGYFLGPMAAKAMGITSGTMAAAAVTGFVGGAGGSLLAGGNLKDALKSGAIAGLTAGAAAGLSGASLTGAPVVDAPAAVPGLNASGSPVVPGAPAISATGEVANMATVPTPDVSSAAYDLNMQAQQAARMGAPSAPATAVTPAPMYDPATATRAVDYGYTPGGAGSTAAYKTPTIGESFSKIGEGLGMGDAPASFETFKQGATDLFSPGPTTEQLKLTPEYADAMSKGKTITESLGQAAKANAPDMLRTYGPAAVAGIGALSAFGGFDTKPVQGGPITQSLMKPVTQRIREGGTQRQMYLQGLPGVVYDEFGAPVFGQSTRLPTYDVPDYNYGGFNMPGAGGQGGMNLPPVYVPPSGAMGSRQVAQPYNTSSMYTNLMGPQRYADGGQVQYFSDGGNAAKLPANFNWEQYVAANPDLGRAGIDTQAEAQEHWINNGLKENRALNPEEGAQRERARLATLAEQKAARDAVAQRKAMRRAAGSGSMYANINAGISALAPETNPMDAADTTFGARNRGAQLANLQQTYGPMLEGQRAARTQQAQALGQAPGPMPSPFTSAPAAPQFVMPSVGVGPQAGVQNPIYHGGRSQEGGEGGPGSSIVMDPFYQPAAALPPYFQQNPDVAAEYQRNTYGLSPEQFAQTHFDRYGRNEQRAAPGMPGMGNSDPFYQPRMDLDRQVTERNMGGLNATPEQLAEMRRLSELSENDPGVNARRDALNEEARRRGTSTAFMNMGGIAALGQGGYPRRNGQISGPGTEKSDSIPAMLSDGEFVMTAKAVRGAGKGSRRAGAKQMYKLMHQLEKNAERG